MRKRRLQFAFMYLGLPAYVLNSAVLAWGFVQCEEPGGTFAIERAGDHSQCWGPGTPTHGHEEAHLPPMECDVCCSCPCIDTPVRVAVAAPNKKTAPLNPAFVPGLCLPASAALTSSHRRLPTLDGHAAPHPDRVTQRCLRTVVLLV